MKKILGLKSRTTTMKNSLEGFRGRFKQAERISKLEDENGHFWTMKMTGSEGQGKKGNLRRA